MSAIPDRPGKIPLGPRHGPRPGLINMPTTAKSLRLLF